MQALPLEIWLKYIHDILMYYCYGLSSVHDIWSEEQITKMFPISRDFLFEEQFNKIYNSAEDPRIDKFRKWQKWQIINQRRYFPWHDNLNSQTTRNRKPRTNIGLLYGFYYSYSGPDAIIFGEVHINK